MVCTTDYRYDLFLGGTCGNSKWRDELIPLLDEKGITYFNPVTEEWNDEAKKREDDAKKNSRYLLFVITDPKAKDGEHISPYSLVEASVCVCRYPNRTIVCFLATEDMPKHLKSALKKIQQDLKELEGAKICSSLEGIFQWL